MATSTLVQYLETTANLAAGGTTTLGGDISDRCQTETFLTVTAITAGQWVAFDTTQTGAAKVVVVSAAPSTFALGNPLVVGVAVETVTGTVASPQPVKVVVGGYVASAAVDNAVVAAGTSLVVDNTAVGRANAYAAADTANPCGVSLTAAAGNLAAVWVYKQF
jgi:hypothetical protein